MRMKKLRFGWLAVSIGFLAACSSTQTSAPVVDRGQSGRADPAKSPATAVPRSDSRGFYTVKRGDTLLSIALEFGQGYRDIVGWNNLANPNDIKVDQVLRVLPPEPGAGGAQTGSVASTGIEVRPLGAPAPSMATGPNKSGPRGDKRPYAEGTLTELQRPDGASAAIAAAPARTEPAKPVEAAPSGNAEDDGVSWGWPAVGRISTGFEDGKKGIDIAGKSGQSVMAASSGKVMYAGSGIRGYGNLVIVKHTNNLLSAYAHNKTILVKEGQTVTKGQKIAEMGNSDSDSVKLHFEIRLQGKPVDPSKYLPTH
jgi:lipoprotein NlpD